MDAAPVVYRYLDYRSFLRDHFAYWSARGGLSHRSFTQRAGFRSPNFLKLVMDGDRRLGPRSVDGVARACRLDDGGARYLGELVALGRARSLSERTEVLERILAFDERVELYPLERSSAEYFAAWWIPVVRELSTIDGFVADPAWVARCLGDRISEAQAAHALEALERLGLLGGGDGSVAEAVTSGDELQTAFMRRYHRQLLRVAGEAIEDTPPDQRDVSTVTITGDEATFREAKRMMQRLRKELLALERRAKSRTQVHQVCLQLFPVAATPSADAHDSEDSHA